MAPKSTPVTTAKKSVKKSTKKPKTKKSATQKPSVWHISWKLMVALLMVVVFVGIFIGYLWGESSHTSGRRFGLFTEGYSTQELLKDLSHIHTSTPPTPPKQMLYYKKSKPQLAIIIDDVTFASQLKRIKALPFKVTPSIFPPYERSMKTPTLAKGLTHYMIHLPMESGSRQFNSQYKTLMRTDSFEVMVERAKELRRLFPTARYINNHTGSRFTADYLAMRQLYGVLRSEGFIFVDSVTTKNTQLKRIAKELGDHYWRRAVFLDNIQTVHAIHKQLRRAVKEAKKQGYAIAIGHPHRMTMQALQVAQPLLKGVEVVYIDEMIKE